MLIKISQVSYDRIVVPCRTNTNWIQSMSSNFQLYHVTYNNKIWNISTLNHTYHCAVPGTKSIDFPRKYNVTKLCTVAASSLEFLMFVGAWLYVKLAWLLSITLQGLTSIVYILGPPENFQKSHKPRPIYSTGCDSSEFVYVRTRSGQWRSGLRAAVALRRRGVRGAIRSTDATSELLRQGTEKCKY